MTTPTPYGQPEHSNRGTTVAVVAAAVALIVAIGQQVTANFIPLILQDFGLDYSAVNLIFVPFVIVSIVFALVAIIAGAAAQRINPGTMWNGAAVGAGAVILITHVLGLVTPLLLQLVL